MSIRKWLTEQFEVSRGLGGQNVRPMEGLRGLAVFLVFLVHYVALMRPWIETDTVLNTFATGIHTIGNTGVDLFFVLSGYLIYGSLIARPQPFFGFMRRRIQRIYPAFIAVFLVYLALSYIFPAQNKIPSDMAEAVIYLGQNFLLLPGMFPIEPMITVAWSLSYEITYYLAIPLVIALFALRRQKPAFRVLVFIAVAGVLVAACLAGGPVQLVLFIAGIILFEAINSFKVRAPGSLIAVMALMFGFAGTILSFEGPVGFIIRTVVLCLAFFVLCLTCFSRPHAAITRAFSLTPIRWLGNMSYSYYLLHGLSLKGYFLVLGLLLPKGGNETVYFWSLLPVMFALSLIPPTVLFVAVERPFSLVKKAKKAVKEDPINVPVATPAT